MTGINDEVYLYTLFQAQDSIFRQGEKILRSGEWKKIREKTETTEKAKFITIRLHSKGWI